MKKDLLTGHLLSEWATKRLWGGEYTCGKQWVDLEPVDVTIVHTEAVKQVSRIATSDFLPQNDSVKSGFIYESMTPRLPRRQMSLSS